MSKESRSWEEITADLRELTARVRGQHARHVAEHAKRCAGLRETIDGLADRQREEAAPARRASLTLVPAPPEEKDDDAA